MKRKLKIGAAFALTAALGFFVAVLPKIADAAPIGQIDGIARWMKGGFFVGATAGKTAANQVTAAYATTVAYDFPSATTTCNDSWGIGLAGLKAGDVCGVSVNQTDVIQTNSLWFAYPSDAGEVKVRHCAVGTAANPPDAGYVVRCWSNQVQ